MMKHVLRACFLLLFLYYPHTSARAQPSDSSFVKPLTFAIRGNFFVYGFLEDLYWMSYTGGAELIWKERHSIGLDAGVFRTQWQTDDTDDQAMYDDFEKRSYLLSDYKCAFYLTKERDMALYLNVYYKFYGKYRYWTRPTDYEGIAENPVYQSRTSGTFHEPGGGIGFKYYFNEASCGVDGSLNVGKRFEVHNEQNYTADGAVTYVDGVNASTWHPYMRITFFYHFGKNRQQ